MYLYHCSPVGFCMCSISKQSDKSSNVRHILFLQEISVAGSWSVYVFIFYFPGNHLQIYFWFLQKEQKQSEMIAPPPGECGGANWKEKSWSVLSCFFSSAKKKQHGVMVRALDLELKSVASPISDFYKWPWASHLTSVCLCFLICKMRG